MIKPPTETYTLNEFQTALISLLEDSQNANRELEEKTRELRKKTRELKKGLEFKTAFMSIMEDLEDTLKQRTAELEKANEELKTLDKVKELDKMKDEFLSITTHELKTPLTPIKIEAQMWLAGKYGEITLKQKESLEIITRNTTRLIHLIDDVMTIAKIDSKKLEFNLQEEDLVEIIKGICLDMQMQAREKNLYLRTKLPEKLPAVYVDKNRIQQILTDLINNALKFTDEGGVTVTVEQEDMFLQVSVGDTGIGIPENELSNIFQRFYQIDHTITRRYGGTGLGLSIVENIVERHGGRIWVKSIVGNGSTFYFTLPLYKPR